MNKKAYIWDVCFVVAILLISCLTTVFGLTSGASSFLKVGVLFASLLYLFIWAAYIKYNIDNHHQKRLYLIIGFCLVGIIFCLTCRYFQSSWEVLLSGYPYMLFGFLFISPFIGVAEFISHTLVLDSLMIIVYLLMLGYALYAVKLKK